MSLLETHSIGIVPGANGVRPLATEGMATQGRQPSGDVAERIQAVAAIAAEHATAVDRDARFPAEAIAAAKTRRLLGLLVPAEFGGDGASAADAVDASYALGRACGSAGLIYAMHQMMVACLVRHASESIWHRDLLRRIGREQLLVASSTTEGRGGGDLRRSECAVEQSGSTVTVSKSATVMSYGAQADVIVTTARRAPDAPPSDQVLVAFHRDQYRLERIGGWDTLGMRGTCSAGFNFYGAGEAGQVLPAPYQTIHAQTGMPVAHLCWSAVWAGIAAQAVDRSRSFARTARSSGGQLPPGVAHLTRAATSLRTLRAVITAALARYEAACRADGALDALEFQTSMNLLKVTASELAVAVVSGAMQVCGLSGYRNDGEFSISRALRDVLSSSVMINNDRILANVATASLLVDPPALLTR